MKIALLLHFYQPYNQQEDILARIVNESYLPLTEGLLVRPRAKLTVNITSSLVELLLNTGHSRVVENIKTLAQRGQIELTGSAKYHAFLPLLPETEAIRQIEQNQEANEKIFGPACCNKVGFFTPEMAVSNEILSIVAKEGYTWMSVPRVAFIGGVPSAQKIYEDEKTGVKLFFRNKRVSSLILSGVCRSAEDLIKETRDIHDDIYWFTVMDAETFGHHRIGHEKFLFEIMDNAFFEPVTVSDLLSTSLEVVRTSIRPSTWTNEEQDFWLDREKTQFSSAKSFILWKDPENPIHALQWELTNYAINEVNSAPKGMPNYEEARELLDKAISSDQFWWASAKPWWSLEMIEQGAYQLKQVLITLNRSLQGVEKAENLYRKILDQAFVWQRTGYIRKKHLENSSTYMKTPFKDRTPAEWHNQLILEFEDEMNKAAENKDFEKAIKWRDALIKIKNGTDIYDVLHVVDELWSARNIPQLKPYLQHKEGEISDFAKGFLKPL